MALQEEMQTASPPSSDALPTPGGDIAQHQGTVKFIQRMMGCSTATSPNKLLFDSALLHDEALGLDVSMKHWGTGLTKWMMFSRTIPPDLESLEDSII